MVIRCDYGVSGWRRSYGRRNVIFSAGGATLGTAAIGGGVATLQTSFASAGSYSVVASYSGDNQNAASVSSEVTVTLTAPDFSIIASPISASITDGQTATTTLTITPIGVPSLS